MNDPTQRSVHLNEQEPKGLTPKKDLNFISLVPILHLRLGH